MAMDLDETLRTQFAELVDETRRPLEDVEQDVRRRVGRRRSRRRRMGAGCGVLAALGVALGAAAVLGDRSAPDVRTNRETPVTTGPPPAPVQPVGVEQVDVYGGVIGTKRIVVHFDAPVPADAPAYIDDIEHPDAPGIVYTTQPPPRVMVCANQHSFAGDLGTVDVLIPTAWLVPGTRGGDIPLVRHDTPAKVPMCGGSDDGWPRDDYIQIAIWVPESDDPDDVTVTIGADGTELIVEISPPG